MEDRKLVFRGDRADVLKGEAGGWSVDQARTRHERGWLREPRRVPERANLSPGLIPRARAAIEAFVRGRMQEQSPEVGMIDVRHADSSHSDAGGRHRRGSRKTLSVPGLQP